MSFFMYKSFFCVCCVLGLVRGYAQDATYEFTGKHFLTSYVHCKPCALMDCVQLRKVMVQAAQEAGAQVLDVLEYQFEGGGYTLVLLLAESHASIHTYPEVSACFVDFFTCGDRCSVELFDQRLSAYLQADKQNQQLILRK